MGIHILPFPTPQSFNPASSSPYAPSAQGHGLDPSSGTWELCGLSFLRFRAACWPCNWQQSQRISSLQRLDARCRGGDAARWSGPLAHDSEGICDTEGSGESFCRPLRAPSSPAPALEWKPPSGSSPEMNELTWSPCPASDFHLMGKTWRLPYISTLVGHPAHQGLSGSTIEARPSNCINKAICLLIAILAGKQGGALVTESPQ